MNTSTSIKTFNLTPSQVKSFDLCHRLISDFKILVIKGESMSGKSVVAREISKQLDVSTYNFDLCDLTKSLTHPLSNQDLVQYFADIILNIQNNTKYQKCSSNTIKGLIYIRHYNRIIDVLTDCYSYARFLLPLILKNVSESMPDDIRILITTQGCFLPEGLHWCVDLSTTYQDMEHILNPFYHNGIISLIEFQHIMSISKVIPIGRILHCMKYAKAMNINNENRDFIESYRRALTLFSGSIVDAEKDVPNPILDDDLVGVDEIIDEINTSIINPMKLNVPGITIKKGLLLCGPPGTGKSSIGRWLAHQIKGKFYLIGGEASIRGSDLIDKFNLYMKKARENAPAVIFIDDCDLLFEHDDIYRAFLTILDGIETNKRNDICVICTCMNMRNVPSSLLRGGRLEMALVTRLPDEIKIKIILEKSLGKMIKTLHEYNSDLKLSLGNISDIVRRMQGWNCADIHRCVNDVARLVIAGKGTNLCKLFYHCIKQITVQYTLCGHCESTNLDYRPYDSYIS